MPDRYFTQTGAWLQEHAGLPIQEGITPEALENILAQRLEMMVEKDFQQFVLLLYQVDVPENKVKEIFASEGYPHVYTSIARLIIQRQTEKIKSRETYRQQNLPDDEEKW